MWTPLSLVAALALVPAQTPPATGGLNLTNVRNTYGELGGTRPPGALLPGDVLFVGFDIEGITVDPAGRVGYKMAMEVLDKAGKPIFKQDPADKKDFVPLGGNKLPARAYITIGLEQQPGEYTLKVTVTDDATNASKTLERKFEVLPKEFGVVAVYTSVDPDGRHVAPTTGIVGQSYFIQFSVVGFGRLPTTKLPSVSVEMIALDEAGRPAVQKPHLLNLDSDVPEAEPSFKVRFLLPLTRSGKFTVQLKATDKATGKTATFNLPIAVVASAN